MRLCLFVYDFPHKKSEEFLLRLPLVGEVVCVLGAPRVDLPPATGRRIKPRRVADLPPADLCSQLGLPYVAVNHAAAEVPGIIADSGAELGVVAGARILKAPVINALPRGVLNFHPGLLPEVRGLDALRWSVLKDVPPGVTAHLIDERVDAGRIVERRRVPLHLDDTWIDVSLRIEETELAMLAPCVTRAFGGVQGQPLPPEIAPTNHRVTQDQDDEAMNLFEQWRDRWASKPASFS